jgi:hypothetical protein
VRLGLFLIVLGALVLILPREPLPDEPRAQAATARSLVTHLSLDVAGDGENPFTHVHDGRRYASAPPGLALALAPAELIARFTDARTRGLLESASAAFGVALLCFLFAAELRRHAARPATTVMATLALAFTTTLVAAGRYADGSALAALLLYFAFSRARRQGTASGVRASIALGALVLVDPSYGLPAAVLMIGAVLADKDRRTPPAIMALAAPLLVGAALVLIHRGHTRWFPTPPGDLLQGVDGLVLSTGKSVFLYSPLLFLLPFALPSFWRERRTEAALAAAVLIATVISAGMLDRWHADPTWGPRRLTPILPIAAEPIALWLDGKRARLTRAAAGVLLVVGLFVQLCGAVWAPSAFPRLVNVVRDKTGAPDWFVDPTSELHFIPQFSPISGHHWMLRHAIHGDGLEGDAPWHLFIPQTPKLTAEWAQIHPDWFGLGAPLQTRAIVLSLGGLLMLAGIAATARRLRMLA